MKTKKSNLILLIVLFFLSTNTLHAQSVSLAENATITSSSTVGGRVTKYLNDGALTPAGPDQYCQTSTAMNSWIQLDLPAEYIITKVELYDGNFGDKGTFNNNLIVTATSQADDFTSAQQSSNPINALTLKNITRQPLNAVEGDLSVTNITQAIRGNSIRIWDTDLGGLRLAEIHIFGKLATGSSGNSNNQGSSYNTTTNGNSNTSTGSNTNNAIYTNNQNSTSSAEPNIEENIKRAISTKDNAKLAQLLKSNPEAFTQGVVDNAFTSGQTEQGKKIVTATGMKPSQAAVNTMLSAGKSALVLDLLNSGTIEGNTVMLNSALKNDQASMVSYLSKRVKPNSETFVLLASADNEDLFEELIDNDNRVPDNKAINIAIDKNNVKIVNLGLNNGGNANEALTYAMTKNNTQMVKIIVTKKGVDGGKAFKYAVDKNDEALFSSLLAMPNADVKTALDEAIKAKNSELAILALETKKTSPTKYLKGAVEAGNVPLAKKIVEVGGDANEGMEAAITKNNTELVEYFISNGASVKNVKFMQEAAGNGNLAVVKLLIESGASANDGIDYAAVNNKEDIVEYLLGKGADANLGMASAAYIGSLSIAKMLIEKGADPTKGVENAVSQNKSGMLTYLIEKRADISSPKLMLFSAGNNLESIVKILLDNKYPVNNPEFLSRAVLANNVNIVNMLLEKGAPATAAGLMETAAANGNVGIVNMLLEKKLDPEKGMLPAVRKNKAEVLQILIDKGAAGNKDQYVAEAVNNKAANVIPILATAGADFKKQDALGNTLLHTATTNNDPNTVTELIKAGVPLDAQNLKGNTALHIAADMTDRVPIIMILAKAGANLNIKNNNRNTPKDVSPAGSKSRKALKDLNAD